MEDSVAVSGTWSYIMAITSGGTLWGWGSNQNGQLGDGTTEDRHNPVRIMDGVTNISIGGNTRMAITLDGVLWGWGRNRTGVLGDGTTRDRSEPVKIMENVVSVSTNGSHTLAVTADGNLWAWGENTSGELGIGTYRGKYEQRPYRGSIPSAWLSPVLVLEYVPEG